MTRVLWRSLGQTLGFVVLASILILAVSKVVSNLARLSRVATSRQSQAKNLTPDQEAERMLERIYPGRRFRVIWRPGESSMGQNAPSTYRHLWYKQGTVVPADASPIAPFPIYCPVTDSVQSECVIEWL